MDENLTSFETFQRLKLAHEEAGVARDQAERAADAAQCLRDIVRLLEDTQAMIDRLEGGMRREVGHQIAGGKLTEADSLRAMVRQYERASWELHGQLRGILDRARRDTSRRDTDTTDT